MSSDIQGLAGQNTWAVGQPEIWVGLGPDNLPFFHYLPRGCLTIRRDDHRDYNN